MYEMINELLGVPQQPVPYVGGNPFAMQEAAQRQHFVNMMMQQGSKPFKPFETVEIKPQPKPQPKVPKIPTYHGSYVVIGRGYM